MTATRMAGKAATIAAFAAVWLAAAALLWRTDVPADLDLPELDPRDYFATEHLRRSGRYERFLRADLILASFVQIAVAVAIAWRAPGLATRLRGGPLLRAVQLALLTLVVLWLARLPFGFAGLWWRRRYDVAREGYVDYLVRPWSTLLAETALVCLAVVGLLLLARRLGQRWWIAGAVLLGALGTAYVVVQPLVLTPRFAPLENRALAADVQALGERMGVDGVDVRLRKARERTRAANAEVVGLGPTRRIVLWDTLVDGFRRDEIRAIAAHELGHVTSRHVWKGLGWLLLAVVPLVVVLDWAARRRGGAARPEAVPAVLAAAVVLQFVATPAVGAITRRYEAEADWAALEATRDPQAMQALLSRLAVTNLADPDPPGWWQTIYRTHPPLVDRIAMAQAWEARRR
ncbi:MAG: M48 family metalloprotease [Thermoleophilia bacterium]|nr:M48 family metalloprotease [Thermoleophilia bacterium]